MKISITLPNYNHGHYIRDNLDGLLAQTYENWELHVVDDGSTDDSAQIIADYATRDVRIKPIYLPHNQGAETALYKFMWNETEVGPQGNLTSKTKCNSTMLRYDYY